MLVKKKSVYTYIGTDQAGWATVYSRLPGREAFQDHQHARFNLSKTAGPNAMSGTSPSPRHRRVMAF